MLRSMLAILLVTFSASVNAQGSNYNYIQGSYGRVELDESGFDVDGNGIGFAASFEIDDNFHVFGEYQTGEFNFGADYERIEFGAGYHTDISPNLDVYANLSYLEIDAESFFKDDAFSIGLGLRGAVSEAVELYGGLDYVDFDRRDSDTRANAGFVLSLTESLGVGIKVSFLDEVNLYQLNARYYFE